MKLARYERAFAIARILGALARWYDWVVAAALLIAAGALVWYGSAMLDWRFRPMLACGAGFVWGRYARRYIGMRLGSHAGGGLLCAEALSGDEVRQFRRTMLIWGGLPLACLAPLAGLPSVLGALLGYVGGLAGDISAIAPQETVYAGLKKKRPIPGRPWLIASGLVLPGAAALIPIPDAAPALMMVPPLAVAGWCLRLDGDMIRFLGAVGYTIRRTIRLILRDFWAFPAALMVSTLCWQGVGPACAVGFITLLIVAHCVICVIVHRLFQGAVARKAPMVAWMMIAILVLNIQLVPGLGPFVAAIFITPFARRARRMTWRL